jgi:hypothetical protein
VARGGAELGGFGEKTARRSARVESQGAHGPEHTNDVDRDAGAAAVAADGGHRGVLVVLSGSLDLLHGLSVIGGVFKTRRGGLVAPPTLPLLVVEHDRHRPVVHEFELHPCAEDARLDVDAEVLKRLAEVFVERLGLILRRRT